MDFKPTWGPIGKKLLKDSDFLFPGVIKKLEKGIKKKAGITYKKVKKTPEGREIVDIIPELTDID